MAVYDFPSLKVGDVDFHVQRMDLSSGDGAGRQNSVQMGWPLWVATYQILAPNDLAKQKWSAWLNRQRGAIHQFRGVDPARLLPAAYRPSSAKVGGLPGAWNGDASSWSVDGARTTLTMAIPTGIILTEGDLIGHRWSSGDKLSLTEVEFGSGGVAAGGSISVKVSPAIPTLVPGGATAYVLRPACLMRLKADTEYPVQPVDGVASGKIVAIQDLRP